MEERRRASRYPVQNVRGTLVLKASAKISNMSLTGMAVESASNLRIGRSYSLRLSHGDFVGPDLVGKVVWCHLQATRPSESGGVTPVYQAGLEFEGMLSGTAHELVEFLRSAAVLTMQQRLVGRFRVTQAESIDLNAEYDFVVKMLSTAGMLIETDISPEIGSSFEMRVKLDGKTISARGQVAHVHDVGEHDKRRISAVGVEFRAISDEDRAALKDFIGSLITPD